MPDRITEAVPERIHDETIVELYGCVSRRSGVRRELAEDITQEALAHAVQNQIQSA